MDDWEFLDEVDVVALLPANFEELRTSKKWQERKEMLETLLSLLEKNGRLSTKCNYGEIVGNLQTMLAKESMIAVSGLTAKCLKGFCTGLRTKFGQYAASLFAVIVEKCKEKKAQLREPLIELMDALATTIPSIEALSEELSSGMMKPNPQIKQQLDLFIYRHMNTLTADKAPKKLIKAIVPNLVKHSADADADVREASFSALGSIQRLVNEKALRSMAGDLDDAKMKKISEFADKAAGEFAEHQAKTAVQAPATASTPAASSSVASASSGSVTTAISAPVEEADPFDFLEPVDVLSKLPGDFQTNMESKKWSERRDALQGFLDLMLKDPKLDPKASYGEMIEQLKRVIEKDANINVAAMAAKCLKALADGLRKKFAVHVPVVIGTILDKFKEKKPVLRDPLVECIDAVAASVSLETIQEDLMAAMGKANPTIKIQTDLFLYRSFIKLNATTMPKKTLKALMPLLVKHTGESDPEVRDSAYAAIGSAMRAIGEKAILPMIADIVPDQAKMKKVKEFYSKACEEAGPEVVQQMIQSVHKADDSAAAGPPKKAAAGPPKKAAPGARSASSSRAPTPTNEDNDGGDESLKPAAGAPPAKKVEKKPAAAKPEAVVEEEAPKKISLLDSSSDKKQRIKEEKTFKLLKWSFPLLSDELVAQLDSQLGAQAKPALYTCLFNKDFKQFIKACELLTQIGETEPEAIVKNSDLLLKWATLRFLETNPSVLIKVLELCKLILQLVNSSEEPMSNEEVSSFVPYLLLKTSEAKDNMRTAVHEIIEELTNICGPFKISPYVIDALKSKNARQRAECLTVLDGYISRAGIAQLTPQGIHKAVAACVSDRDTNVRNAAINALVTCYSQEGDQMWRSCGKMADKDRAMVEERIKRRGAVAGSASAKGTGTPARGGAKVVVPESAGRTVRGGQTPSRDSSVSRLRDREAAVDEDAGNSTIQSSRNRSPVSARETANKYRVDDDFVEMRGEHALNSRRSMDQMAAYQPPVMTVYSNNSAPSVPTTPLRRTGSSSSISSIDTMDHLEKVVQNISSGLSEVACEALEQVIYMMQMDEQREMIDSRSSLVLRAVGTQMNLVLQQKLMGTPTGQQLLERIARFLDLMIMNRSGNKMLNVTDQAMYEWLYAIISLLHNLKDTDEAKRGLNMCVIRACSRIELTAFVTASIRGLQRALQTDVRSELVTLFNKCLYKWQGHIDKMPRPLRLHVFWESICELHKNVPLRGDPVEDDIIKNAHRSLEMCVDRALTVMGDVVLKEMNAFPDMAHSIRVYTNTAYASLISEQGWQPLLPGQVAPEPVEQHSARSSTGGASDQLVSLLDRLFQDLTKASDLIPQLLSYLEQNHHDRDVYEDCLNKAPSSSIVRELVEDYQANGSITFVVTPTLARMVASDQRLSTFSLQNRNGDGSSSARSNVLQNRDINTESISSEVHLPANLSGATPAQPAVTVKKPKRRSIDPRALIQMQSRLNNITD